MAVYSIAVARVDTGRAYRYRWVCSCGRKGKKTHGFPGLAEQAGYAHRAGSHE